MASQHLQAIFQSACLIVPTGVIAAPRNWNQVKRINIHKCAFGSNLKGKLTSAVSLDQHEGQTLDFKVNVRMPLGADD